MRGRIGGRIGRTVLPVPGYLGGYGSSSSQGSAKGVWGVGEVFLASRGYIGGGYDYYGGSTWPTNSITVEWPVVGGYYSGYETIDYIDATVTGEGTFSPIVTTNYSALAYSWEKSTNGGETWSVVPGETTENLTLTGVTLADDGTKYRLIADAGLKQVASTPGTVRFDTATLSITGQPYNITSDWEGWFSCYAQATGVNYGKSYEASYQWQRSTDGGATWTNIAGAVYGEYYFTANSSMDGYKYRCVVSFAGQTLTSNVATFTYAEGYYY